MIPSPVFAFFEAQDRDLHAIPVVSAILHSCLSSIRQSCPTFLLSLAFLTLDKLLGSRVKHYLTLGLCVLDSTGLMFITWYCRWLGVAESLFRFRAVWGVVFWVELLIPHARGLITDDELENRAGWTEWQFLVYFFPIVLRTWLLFLWRFRGVVAVEGVTLVGAWMVLPLAVWIRIFMLMYWAAGIPKVIAKYIRSTAWLMMSVVSVLRDPFDRSEIGYAQRRANESATEPYKYSRIDGSCEVRLILLNRRVPGRPLSCEIRSFPLNAMPSYEALSYTWGPTPPSIPIAVSQNNHILVTKSVQEFLYYQRSYFTRKFFWIDAICIDQGKSRKSTAEREKQLLLMTKIYTQASRVIVWLDPPKTCHETRALRLIIPLVFEASMDWTNRWVHAIKLPEHEEGLRALCRLFQHQWFERMWIVQEVAVGTVVHVMHGGVCLRWDRLVNVALRAQQDLYLRHLLYNCHGSPSPVVSKNTQSADHQVDFRPFNYVESQLKRSIVINNIKYPVTEANQRHLGWLLSFSFSFRCQNARDKVYALMGIAKREKEWPFKPRYTKSISTLYRRTMKYMLQQNYWFEALTLAGCGYDELNPSLPPPDYRKSLPSWVPDFNSSELVGRRSSSYSRNGKADLPQGSVSPVGFATDPKVIELQVHSVDTVQQIVPRYDGRSPSPSLPIDDPTMDSPKWKEYFDNTNAEAKFWYRSCRDTVRNNQAVTQRYEGKVDEKLWDLCIEGDVGNRISASGLLLDPQSAEARIIGEFFITKTFEEMMQPDQNLVELGMTTPQVFRAAALLGQRFWEVTYGRTMAVTTQGYLALVPPKTCIGDKVVHVQGGDALCLIRPEPERTDFVEWVGICSVLEQQGEYLGEEWSSCLVK